MLRKFLLVVIALVAVVTGFFYFAVNYQRPFVSVRVVDDRAEELELLNPPERLVVLTPGAGRLLALLQPAGRVVGASDDLTSLFPQAENLGNASGVAATRIVALRPDLVLLSAPLANLANELTEAGVNAFLLSPGTLEQIFAGIERVGIALEREQEASDLQAQLTGRLQQLGEKVAAQPYRPRVLFWLDEALRYPEKDGFLDKLIITAGGQNIATELSETPEFAPPEALLAAPDVIIGPQAAIDAIRIDGRWKDVPAVVNNRLHIIPGNFSPITWENLIDRLEFLYVLFYPPVEQP